MRIAFFGASVTKQSGDGSYIEHLRALVPQHEILKFGFGACHFDDAGFHKLDQVLDASPERVVLEWNTTGLASFNMLKLGTVVRRILESGALPSFLVLPRRDSIGVEPRIAEVQVREFCQRHRVPILDFTSGFEPEGLLRDMVHTTPVGAAHFAAPIAAWLDEGAPAPLEDCRDLPRLSSSAHPISTDISADAGLRLHLLRSGSPIEEMVAEVIVGPNIVDLEIEAAGRARQLSLVDRWCHYERHMFHTLWRGDTTTYPAALQVSLKAAPIPPDYSVLDKPRVIADTPPSLRVLALHLTGVELHRVECLGAA
jgi:hypothetical protein